MGRHTFTSWEGIEPPAPEACALGVPIATLRSARFTLVELLVENNSPTFPASRMRNLRKSDISCPGVYPGNGKMTDVGYLYCEPWTNRDPAHTSSFHIRTTPVLMRSGRVVVFPMHVGYAMYSGNNPEYNGFLPNADVFAETGTVQGPINTCGRY